MSVHGRKIKKWILATSTVANFSCATPAAKNDSKAESAEEKNLSKEEQALLEEYKAEVELGRNMAGRLLQYYGTFGDDSLVGYVNQVGNYVASYSDYPDRKYMFAILDTDAINAFACPGGYILVTLGTLRHAKDEAELAAVLGHEAAHVGKKHMFNTLKSIRQKSMEDEAKETAKKKQVQVPYESKVRERAQPEDSALGSLVAKYLSGSAGAGMSLLQAAQAGMSVILEKGLDKKLEYEADYEGVKYAVRAGYEPKAMIDFLGRLQKKKKKLDTKTLDKTHPKIKNRTKRIAKLLNEMNAEDIIGAGGVDRYKTLREALPPEKSKA